MDDWEMVEAIQRSLSRIEEVLYEIRDRLPSITNHTSGKLIVDEVDPLDIDL